MFYFIPVVALPLQNIEFAEQIEPNYENGTQLDIPQGFQPQYYNESKQISDEYWQLYLKIFHEELTILYAKQKKKVWTPYQDQILLNLNQNQIDWKKISNMFEGTNPEICKRRYYRIIEKFLRWPKDIDQQIKYMRDVKMRKWSYIAKTIQQKFGNFRYTGKMIKERYEFYLRGGIQLKQWAIQEDIKLLDQVRNKGRYWKNIMPSFPGRTELQLKNRYNGTLKLIEKRVLNKLNQLRQDKIENK